MKNNTWTALGVAAFMLWILPEQVTRPILHLLVLGIVPGTDYELGLYLPLAAIIVGVFLLTRWAREASEALMEYKTEMNIIEREQAEDLEVQVTANQLMDEEAEIEIISI